MRTWGIIGLGWLGQALADHARQNGDQAWGTHRADFTFGTDPFPTRACDVLVLNTPPLTDLAPTEYVVPANAAGHVIFISSTSVYGAGPGRVTEASPVDPVTDSARWLVAVEAKLRNDFGERVSIVRPGGLIGGQRHPAIYLARGGRAIEDGPVNLIHRADLIRILMVLADAPRPLVNAVSPHHPDKSAYYGAWARRMNLGEVRVDRARRTERVIDSSVLPQIYPTWACAQLDRLEG